MTKAEFISAIKEQGIDLSKRELENVVNVVFETMRAELLRNERFAFPGFGTFTVTKRAPRKGRNPRTGETIDIPASRGVSFKPAPAFKDEL